MARQDLTLIESLMVAVALMMTLSSVNLANAEIPSLSAAQKESIFNRVSSTFWSLPLKNRDGSAMVPPSEEERKRPLIDKALSMKVIDYGVTTGSLSWCKMDWQTHFLALTKAARAKGLNNKQVTFISILHGAAQGVIEQQGSIKQCDNETKNDLNKMVIAAETLF